MQENSLRQNSKRQRLDPTVNIKKKRHIKRKKILKIVNTSIILIKNADGTNEIIKNQTFSSVR